VTDDFFVITTKSGLQKDALQSIFGKTVQVAVHEDLIWQRIETLFSDYVEALKEDIVTEKYYVTPRNEETTGPRDRLDETIISYLAGRSNVGCINVVSASAGVGKTTLARYAVKRLAERASTYRVIPTYVEASHWGKLQLDSV
jgi:predicted GTPase